MIFLQLFLGIPSLAFSHQSYVNFISCLAKEEFSLKFIESKLTSYKKQILILTSILICSEFSHKANAVVIKNAQDH